jgi:hypothetical protein
VGPLQTPEQAAVVVVLLQLQMAQMAVLAHFRAVAAVVVDHLEQDFLQVLVALVVRDIARSTHGKLIRRN